jgi:hypothetical protein
MGFCVCLKLFVNENRNASPGIQVETLGDPSGAIPHDFTVYPPMVFPVSSFAMVTVGPFPSHFA